MPLLMLGKYLLLNIAKDWLFLEEICRLDTAFCSSQDRHNFLKYLRNTPLMGAKNVPHLFKMLDWFCLRGVGVEILELDDFKRKDIVKLSEFGSQLAPLQKAHISNCNDSIDKIFRTLNSCCPKLSFIDLKNVSNFSSEILSDLITTNASRLIEFNVLDCPQISDKIILHVCKLCNYITSLRLDGCRLRNETVCVIGQKYFKQLIAFHLTDNDSVYEQTLSTIVRSNPELTDLSFSSCSQAVNSKLLQNISEHCRGLKRLNVSKNIGVSDEGIAHICLDCTQITDLDIHSCPSITLQSIHMIASQLCKLQRISFFQASEFSCSNNTAFLMLTQNFRSVTNMDIEKCVLCGAPYTRYNNYIMAKCSVEEMLVKAPRSNTISYSTFEAGAAHVRYLTSLTVNHSATIDAMEWCVETAVHLTYLNLDALGWKVTDDTLDMVPYRCRHLRDFSMTGAEAAEEFIVYLVCENPHLLRLKMVNCNGVNDVVLSRIADCCKKLQVLNLSQCRNVSDSGLMEVVLMCRSLVTLDVSRCARVTDRTVRLVRESCPYMQNLNVFDTSVTHQDVEL